MIFKAFPTALLLALLLFWLPGPALAWGEKGHAIVAGVALAELDPAARVQVADLLGSDRALVGEASWADTIRSQRPETARWHFVDIPLAAPHYEAWRDCPRQACVVAQIGRDLAILSNPRLERSQRAEALLFLVHFVGDLHQPLHVVDNHDEGGNAVRVVLGREHTNLHRLWDVDVLKPLGPDADTIAATIEAGLTPGQRKLWAQGTPALWAKEVHGIARAQIYPALGGARNLRLAPGDLWRQTPLARRLLAEAGVRLAWLINRTLG